jgi:hypothetical protein
MLGGKIAKRAVLIGAIVAAFQSASFAANPTIYFTGGGSPPLPSGDQLLNGGSGAHTATFTASSGNTLLVTGSNSVYEPGYANNINGGSGDLTDYVNIGGFSPSADSVFVGLKLDNDGSPITPGSALAEQIILDIKTNPSNTGVTASDVTGGFASVFAGYDVLLSFASDPTASAPGQFDVGFDFSSYTPTGGGSVTVTNFAVVPEPGCLGLLSVAGLVLLPRYRRNRA